MKFVLRLLFGALVVGTIAYLLLPEPGDRVPVPFGPPHIVE